MQGQQLWSSLQAQMLWGPERRPEQTDTSMEASSTEVERDAKRLQKKQQGSESLEEESLESERPERRPEKEKTSASDVSMEGQGPERRPKQETSESSTEQKKEKEVDSQDL